MSDGIKFEVVGKRNLEISFDKINKGTLKHVNDAINKAAILIHGTAVKSIQQGAKTGIAYKTRGRTHIASAPGQPPASDTGNLATALTFEIEQGKSSVVATVISRAPYSAALELGSTDKKGKKLIAPRPFMEPALAENAPEIDRLLKAAVKKGLRSAN